MGKSRRPLRVESKSHLRMGMGFPAVKAPVRNPPDPGWGEAVRVV
ncbi:MAG: hypothetical protein QW569_02315 [Candidatus Bathyarchaeia archaeon]